LGLARDLAHGREMSVLFSSHLLPDVESVCDHVLVLGAGRLLAQGQIREMKNVHEQCYEVRVKADASALALRLSEAGCTVNEHDHMLLVRIPPGQSVQMLWAQAAAAGVQIRHLRPQRSTLEEVFLKALEQEPG
jgi:ABC-2 type transport system ATP-binding protein